MNNPGEGLTFANLADDYHDEKNKKLKTHKKLFCTLKSIIESQDKHIENLKCYISLLEKHINIFS